MCVCGFVFASNSLVLPIGSRFFFCDVNIFVAVAGLFSTNSLFAFVSLTVLLTLIFLLLFLFCSCFEDTRQWVALTRIYFIAKNLKNFAALVHASLAKPFQVTKKQADQLEAWFCGLTNASRVMEAKSIQTVMERLAVDVLPMGGRDILFKPRLPLLELVRTTVHAHLCRLHARHTCQRKTEHGCTAFCVREPFLRTGCWRVWGCTWTIACVFGVYSSRNEIWRVSNII